LFQRNVPSGEGEKGHLAAQGNLPPAAQKDVENGGRKSVETAKKLGVRATTLGRQGVLWNKGGMVTSPTFAKRQQNDQLNDAAP